MNDDTGNTRFYEVQHFWQQPLSWLVWLVCIPVVLMLLSQGAIHGLFAYVSIIIMGGLIALVMFSKLTTEVSTSGVTFRMTPFHGKPRHVSWDEIESCVVRKYSPLKEFGGWGIRIGMQGTAYNVKGNMGFQFQTHEGKRILIGTQRPDDLNNVLEHLGKL